MISVGPALGASPSLRKRFAATRAASLALAAPLTPEDTVVQSMPDASPTKWHLAHTTWFFEEFVLSRCSGHRFHAPAWRFLFNSYYQAVGPMHARGSRGLISRPGLIEVLAYREAVDAALLDAIDAGLDAESSARVALGIQHEQQHQELMLTDIKHVLWCNPLRPAYRDDLDDSQSAASAQAFIAGREGLVEIGADAGAGFVFDCETPRHQVLLHPHRLARRPVSNAEFRQFIDEGGYRTAALWLSDGWSIVQAEGWFAPLYWDADLGHEFTLGGTRPIDPHAPVCHVSYFEADAFARWAGARLATEAEWESAASDCDPAAGNSADSGRLQPVSASAGGAHRQLFGDVWEWTASPYVNYPRFRPLPGALGEYNGKFMCGQWVLRGGSCATPAGHLRASYRNFFPPAARWQFSGIRLAQDA